MCENNYVLYVKIIKFKFVSHNKKVVFDQYSLMIYIIFILIKQSHNSLLPLSFHVFFDPKLKNHGSSGEVLQASTKSIVISGLRESLRFLVGLTMGVRLLLVLVDCGAVTWIVCFS